MRLRLMAYTPGGYEEYRLPAINNADYTIRLPALLFKLKGIEDISLQLEIRLGIWKALEGEGYSLCVDSRHVKELVLQDGCVFVLHTPRHGETLTFVVSGDRDVFSPFDKRDVSRAAQITIGREKDCHIRYDFMGIISKRHAVLEHSDESCVLYDTSINGVYVNGQRVQGSIPLQFGDRIHILGLRLVWLCKVLAVYGDPGKIDIDASVLPPLADIPSATPNPQAHGPKYFKRTPRSIAQLHTESVEIEAPPPPNQKGKQPLLLTIGPAFTMMLPMLLGSGMAIVSAQSSGAATGSFMYTGIITAVTSAFIGVMWAVINLRYTKKQAKAEEQRRLSMYRDYLVKIADRLKEQYAENASVLHERYPAASECARYNPQTSRLWNRNRSHSDFLFARLGIGMTPFQVTIQVPKDKFSLIDDSQAGNPKRIQESFKNLRNVPVGIDLLKTRLLGVYGDGDMRSCLSICRSMAVQFAANNCYTDVKLVFIYDQGHEREMGFAKWLPHVWSEDRKTRYIAMNRQEANEALYTLAGVLRIRAEQNAFGGGNKEPARPHYVVFVCNPELLEGEPAAKYLLEPSEGLGVSTVLAARNYEALPNCCRELIQNDSDFRGVYDASAIDGNKQAINFDFVDAAEAETFARTVSNVRVNELESGGELTSALTFFDMHEIVSLEQLQVYERWLKNRTYENMKALVGQKAGGANLYLDIHEKYHGPHGLVAGTTGSGKSETLQTYILSLAINFSPLDVGFFIIDYKGGGMANLFSGLPHMLGQISNLSGNQVHRAMVSIKSEIRRRQRIFGEYDVNHLDQYTRLLKNNEATIPIQHLLIIIDEFAELKREEPDFMRELISVAQVGRSLGIHLILATQKPAGTVDDNIWSNSKFKLCLRVQDRQDSMDMLKRPDAAYITQAGRCYFQVGNDEIFELFQSGWSGATWEEDMENTKAEIATMLSTNGQPSIVGNRSKIRRRENKRNGWIELLTGFVHGAERNCGVSVTAAAFEERELSAVIQNVFGQIRRANIDYPFNQYNARRIEEFIGLMRIEQDDTPEKLVSAAQHCGVMLPEIKGKTQLTAVVEYLAVQAKTNNMEANVRLWLPVLPEACYLKDLFDSAQHCFSEESGSWPQKTGEWALEAIIGLCDDPVNQAQNSIGVNFAQDGHIAVCGMVVSGKTTFLQTLLYSLVNRHSPEDVNLYILDYNSRALSCFEGLAHCGGVVFEDQGEKTGKLFSLLKKELDRRKTLFQGGNFSQFIRAHGKRESAIVLAVDGFANFKEKTDNRYEDILILLSREGANYGIFLLLSAGGFGVAEIQNRIGENIKTVFCLQMGDPLKYMDILRIRPDVIPETGVIGRGLALVQGTPLEFQTALSLAAEDDYQRGDKIKEHFDRMNGVWTGKRARPVPTIPDRPFWQDFAQLPDYQAMLKADSMLPLGYRMEDADVNGIDLRRTFTYLIGGKARSGKSNLLRCLMCAAADRGGMLVVIDSISGEMELPATQISARYVKTDEDFRGFAEDLLKDMVERNSKMKELRAQGADEETIYRAMSQYAPIFLFIDNLNLFLQRVYAPSEEMMNIVGFLENFFDKGALHNMYVFMTLPLEEYGAVLGRQIFTHIASRKKGLLLGGSVSEQRLFDMTGMPFQEQTKPLKPGIAVLPASDEYEQPIKIVLPLAKG